MKRQALCFLMLACLLLGGCVWLEESYVSVTPHRVQTQNAQMEAVSASTYRELCDALEEMIDTGTESGIINVAGFNQDNVESSMENAADYAVQTYPIGAYAVDEIQYEVGTNSGKPAIAVTISYRHSRVEIQKIRRVSGMTEAEAVLVEALEGFDSGVVLLVNGYESVDFAQLVEDYAALHPETIMEIPQVNAGVYPDSGRTRVVELTFTYQTSRDSLRQMQLQVKRMFDSADLYVSGDAEDNRKLTQLYAFLMERFDYTIETSITPAYSLLRHGVGDSRAFAEVYSSMCRLAGLECMVVSGTRSGDPWHWNIVKDGDHYFHVDLLRCSTEGGFREYTDPDMSGYVWDYSAFPECPEIVITQPEPEPETTEPSEGETEPTETQDVEEAPETEPSEEPTENPE